jgi:hypothetical protein
MKNTRQSNSCNVKPVEMFKHARLTTTSQEPLFVCLSFSACMSLGLGLELHPTNHDPISKTTRVLKENMPKITHRPMSLGLGRGHDIHVMGTYYTKVLPWSVTI